MSTILHQYGQQLTLTVSHTMCSVGEGSMCLDVFCEQKKHKLESRDRQKYLGLTYLGGIFLLPR